MLSRRSTRIKVLQCLYTQNRNPDQSRAAVEKYYLSLISDSFKLLMYNLTLLERIASYSRQDVAIKTTKYLPTEEDKFVSDKLWGNPLTQTILGDAYVANFIAKSGLMKLADDDIIRKAFKRFTSTQDYKDYLLEGDKLESHREILLKLYKFISTDEVLLENMEDHFPSYPDDESLVAGSMKKIIKSLPSNKEYHKEFLPDKELTEEFGLELLIKVLRDDEELSDIIKPLLKNWEMDRLAVIDLIVLKMATAELLHFPTIPTKATLNEYVDIVKLYSTPKSKDFVNGVMDRLMKQLTEQGRIVKTGRGLID